MKYVSIDIETLGLNIDAPIIEVACVFVDNGKIVAQNQTYVTHYQYDNCEPFAMSMHPEALRRIAEQTPGFDYCPIDMLAAEIRKWCLDAGFDPKDKINFAGKNAASFDLPMLDHQTEGEFNRLVNPYHRVLDPGPMFARRGANRTPNLETILTENELDGQVTHTAMDDARAAVTAIEHFFSQHA